LWNGFMWHIIRSSRELLLSGYIKGDRFLDYLFDYQLIKKASAPRFS